MEHIEYSLEEVVSIYRENEEMRVNIYVSALMALQKLHEIGLTHRDVKPDNIRIAADR